MKPVSQSLSVMALALIAGAAATPAHADVMFESSYPHQISIEARAVTATHPLNRPAMVAEKPHIDVVINFSTNVDKLSPSSRAQIKKVAAILKSDEYKGKRVNVNGYTDSVGKPAANQRLSYRRARHVVRALVAEGVPAGMLSAQGYGEENPIATNSTPEGRAMNRRVTFSVVCPMMDK